MLEAILIIFGSLIFICLLSLAWGITNYNSFIALRQDINTQFSNIKAEYQRRMDLFINLVESVKSYKKHEKETLVKVIEARKNGFSGDSLKDMKKMKRLDGLFSKLLAVAENYPDLKANEQHNKLIDEVRITEDRINVARTDYNSIVRDYNVKVGQFPSNVIANMFRFKLEEFFKSEEGLEKAPKISLI